MQKHWNNALWEYDLLAIRKCSQSTHGDGEKSPWIWLGITSINGALFAHRSTVLWFQTWKFQSLRIDESILIVISNLMIALCLLPANFLRCLLFFLCIELAVFSLWLLSYIRLTLYTSYFSVSLLDVIYYDFSFSSAKNTCSERFLFSISLALQRWKR